MRSTPPTAARSGRPGAAARSTRRPLSPSGGCTSAAPAAAVYAFWASSGANSWTASTGAYVYASPAVADVPGLGPTVYIGSYDGDFYAFSAIHRRRPVESRGRRPDRRFGHRHRERRLLLEPRLEHHRGLNWRSGRQVFSFPDGEFTPVITDGKVVFLIGYSTIYQMVRSAERTRRPVHRAVTRAPRRAARRRGRAADRPGAGARTRVVRGAPAWPH